MKKEDFFETIRGNMIVSCQAVKGEPLYDESRTVMHLMARAAKAAGAPAIRTSSVRDVKAVKAETGLPVIGLIKIQYDGYESYITPTLREVDALAEAGADAVALDCTDRRRGDGRTAAEYLQEVRKRFPDMILMADIATYEEGVTAWKCGADLVGTTMSGYTAASKKADGSISTCITAPIRAGGSSMSGYSAPSLIEARPDYILMERLSSNIPIPVIGEGRIHTPHQAVCALHTGVWAIVVGGAITRPLEIAGRFMEAIRADRERPKAHL